MKPSDAYLKAKRDILELISVRIEQLTVESNDLFGTPDYFILMDKADELEFMRGKIRNIILADRELNDA